MSAIARSIISYHVSAFFQWRLDSRLLLHLVLHVLQFNTSLHFVLPCSYHRQHLSSTSYTMQHGHHYSDNNGPSYETTPSKALPHFDEWSYVRPSATTETHDSDTTIEIDELEMGCNIIQTTPVDLKLSPDGVPCSLTFHDSQTIVPFMIVEKSESQKDLIGKSRKPKSAAAAHQDRHNTAVRRGIFALWVAALVLFVIVALLVLHGVV